MKRKDRSPETANNVGGESSSTSNTPNSSPPWEYDVFLSFYGNDTRLKFIDHLYDAFIRSGINAFRDNEGIERGQVISHRLHQAIKGSLCAVVVLSENYADSKWCLEELRIILECRKNLDRQVFPIFYDIDPSDVRRQGKKFGEALAEHEKKFEQNKVQNWRNALSEIGSIAGWTTSGRHEANLIKNIVGDVWSFLSTKLPSFDDNLVGIDSKVADVIPFLEIGLDDKRFVGIWGMGGVGKTTLARVVFEKISVKFDISCFLYKVKDVLPKGPKGLVSLQKHLLSHLKVKGLKIYDPHDGRQTITRFLPEKKVLLVVDDIDDMNQIAYLAASPDWFGKGSRIIITTRDSHVLTSIGVESIYEMKTLNDDESLQIFSKKAFNKNHPEKKYLEYSKSFVKYAGGLPLALQALGSYICKRSEEAEWIDALVKLKQITHRDIVEVLKISYDRLDEKEQTIFLDIVCLFKRWKKEEVTEILKGCDLNPVLGIKVLIEKTLLVETEDGTLDMHDLYVELGWHIIKQNYPNSRLRNFEEIKEILENNKGSGVIEAIVVKDQGKLENKIKLHPEAFSKMSRLRLLIFYDLPYVPKGLKKCSGALKFVKWPSFPLEALPFRLDELVHIEMPNGNIKQLWNGLKPLNHLKFINLRGSHKVTETPDFSNVQSLEHLNLARCTSLVKVHESLGVLKKLVEVDLHGCENLQSLPSKLETNSLRKLDLWWCKNVKKLPKFGKGMEKLSYLNVSRTVITRLPESIGFLTGLRYLDARHSAITGLPESLGSLIGLRYLDLSHTAITRLPKSLRSLIGLRCLDVSCTGITSLPESFGSLTGLRYLCLRGTGLENLPTDCFSGLFGLLFLSLAECKSLMSLPRLPPRLIRLEADGCDSMKRSLNEQLLNLVTSLDHEIRGQTKYVISNEEEENMLFPFEEGFYSPSKLKYVEAEYHPLRNFFAIMPSGGIIPSWFGPNIKYCDVERYKCEINVDVPPHFRASKWSGIVVCLFIEGCASSLSWSSKAPDDKSNSWSGRVPGFRSLYKGDGLYIMVLEFNQETCWKHLRGDSNSLHIQFYSYDRRIDIWGCGWRVISKEDIQKWSNPNHFNQFTQPQHVTPFEVKLPLGLLDMFLDGARRL